jgi:TIR domain
MSGSEKTKPLIFISHSAKDAEAMRVLRRLFKVLSRDFEVLLDRKRLRAGDDWRRELHTWMGLADGAVVLLSEDALCRSDWVLREATVLGYRREDEEDFILVPVLLDPVTPDRLGQGGFRPLELGAIQAARGDSPDDIARRVSAALAPLRGRTGPRTPLQRAEEVVARILSTQLEEGARNPKPIFDAAAARMGRRVRWNPRRGYGEQLARQLLGAPLEKSLMALVYLAPYFRDKAEAERLLDHFLRPFWVHPDALPELARIHRQPRGRRAVGVNGVEYPFTCESYVLRACGVVRKWVYAKITEKKGYEEAPAAAARLLEEEVLSQVKPLAGFEEEEEATAEAVEGELDARSEPFFILVPPNFNERQIELLRSTFQAFTFFFLYGEQPPDEQALGGEYVVLLKPVLSGGVDRQVNSLIRRARSEIRRTQ